MTATAMPQDHAAHRRQGVLLVFAAGILWSTSGLGIRLMPDASVWQIVLYRAVSLSAFLWIFIRLRSGHSPWAAIRTSGRSGLLAALAMVVASSTGIYAFQTTSVANAMLLFASAPFMTAALGWLILGEPVRRTTLMAMAAAAAGIAIMVSDKTSTGVLLGNLGALTSALGFALFTIALRHGRRAEMMPSVLLSGLLSVVVMTLVCLALGLPLLLPAREAGLSMSLGVFQLGAGLVLYTIGSRHVPAAELALLSMAEVILGPLWVWLVLSEVPTPATMAGGAVILAALVANALGGMRRKPPVTLS